MVNRHGKLQGSGARNVALTVLLLLIAATAIWISDRFADSRAIAGEQDRLINVARLTAASYQRQVDKFRLVATTLSADSDVAALLDRPTAAAADRLNQRLASLTTALDASVIYLLNADGTTIASSNWRQPDSFLNENYRFRAYFTRALSDGEWEQFALGTRSRLPGLFVARRVDTGARSRGVIVVKIRFDRLEREWARSAWAAFVANTQGVILVSSVSDWRFQTVRQLSDAEQASLGSQVEFGTQRLRQNALFARRSVADSAQGFNSATDYIAAREALPNGWSVHILSPVQEPVAAARTFGRLVVLIIAIIAAALFGFYNLRRRAIIAGEQQEHAARIADLKDRLAQSNKLSTLGQIAAGVGHELNQPLTAIGLRAKNAIKLIEAERHSEAAAALQDIGALTARAGAITQELRRFSRRADRHIGKVSVQAVLAGTQLLLGDRLRSTNTRLSVDPTDTNVLGEQGRLEQVFVNLIQNAMDAMGNGGRIDIIVTRAEPWVSIAVRDTGPGISAELRGSLFEPFTSSKPDGVGLGLVICRDIVTQFGGELSIGDVSTGTEFRILLKSAA